MAPAPAAGVLPSRPVVPAAQPAVTKPLFPSAAQVGIPLAPQPLLQTLMCTVVLIRPVPISSKRIDCIWGFFLCQIIQRAHHPCFFLFFKEEKKPK